MRSRPGVEHTDTKSPDLDKLPAADAVGPLRLVLHSRPFICSAHSGKHGRQKLSLVHSGSGSALLDRPEPVWQAEHERWGRTGSGRAGFGERAPAVAPGPPGPGSVRFEQRGRTGGWWSVRFKVGDPVVELHQEDKEAILRNAGAKNPTITRCKGLGEMQPEVLWDTTLNPETRSLLRVEIPDRKTADGFIVNLMGKDPAERRLLIRDGAPDPAALDL